MSFFLRYKNFLPILLVTAVPISATPLITSGNFSLDWLSLTNPGGGRKEEVKILGEIDNEEIRNLKISEKASNLALKDYLRSVKDDLSLYESKDAEFDIKDKVQDDQRATGLVKDLHSQVNLEGGVLKVGKDTIQKYSDHTKGIEKHQFGFKKGLEVVQRFQQKSNKRTKKAAKAPKKDEPLTLNKESRQAIKKFYETFDKLSAEEKHLLTRLNQMNGQTEKSNSLFAPPHKLQDVLTGLRRIGWEKDKAELVSKSLDKRKHQPTLANWYGWGSWEASPWKYFFDSAEDWKSKISDVEQAKVALQKYLDSKRGCIFAMAAGPWGVNKCYSEKSKYESKIAGAEEAISLHIASWMVKHMNLLN